MQKYEFTVKKKMVEDSEGVERELRQIIATKGFNTAHGGFVLPGTLGGWIEQESNLSQEGTCWLNENSYAFHDSMIAGNAYVENSRLYHEVIVEDDVYIYESKLHGKTLICGDTEVEYSLTFGDTTLGGFCNVENSNLTNVRLLVGSKDKNTWKSCRFENTLLKSDAYMVEFSSSADLKDVHLTGRKIKVESPIVLERVHGEEIQRLIVKQELEMSDVLLEKGASVLIKGNKKTAMIGTPTIKQGDSIVINSTGFIVKNSLIKDQVQIHGHWIVTSSEIAGDVLLQNQSDKTHILHTCDISEYAKVTAQGQFDDAKTIVAELAMDNEYEIT